MEEAEQDTLAPPDTIAEILSPTEIKAFDTPNDAGENITITWEAPEDPYGIIVGYEIFRSEDLGK
ncbi:unnamed protein product [marine sediment metagenome]|uniref:Fibronectin type-III domain-containing protein n=2 Tax=marine sediment metagenome TaxID=412755 RepID=X1F1S1_9ZZZZ